MCPFVLCKSEAMSHSVHFDFDMTGALQTISQQNVLTTMVMPTCVYVRGKVQAGKQVMV